MKFGKEATFIIGALMLIGLIAGALGVPGCENLINF